VEAIDCFMAAIRKKESGGNYGAINRDSGAGGAYQFMPATWRYALSLAGLAGWSTTAVYNAPPWVQDAAARALMGRYFTTYRSWYSVAEAWYGGPGAVGHPSYGGGPGYPTVGQYAQSIVTSMSAICAGTGTLPPTVIVPPFSPPAADLSQVTNGWNYMVRTYSTDLQALMASIMRIPAP
jgi:hypothetical protein